jgi:RNA polymerase sigma-70 factor (ECF subfamily)
MQKSEKQILSQIRKGDIGAYKYLFESYYKELYFFSRKFLGNKEVAEEIVQDVFIALWENKDNLYITKSIKSYLYTSVKNRSINYLKSKINNKDFVGIDEVVKEGNVLQADRLLELSELDDLIVEAVSKLPPKCKEMFHMSRNSEMTYQEIADALNVSKETVKSQISEALKRIKVYLNKHWEQIPS